jgi:hypothetical protein
MHHNSAILQATEIYQYERESSNLQDSNDVLWILVARLVWSQYAFFWDYHFLWKKLQKRQLQKTLKLNDIYPNTRNGSNSIIKNC